MVRMWKLVLTFGCLLALAGLLIMQLVLGCMGLVALLGPGGAVAGVLLWLLLGWRLPLKFGAFWGALTLWHWPWFPALMIGAPRELLMVPGLVSRLIARLRHPPPVWRGVPTGAPQITSAVPR
jgi:hypothetical protein